MKQRQAPPHSSAKTIAWFEQAVQASTPKTGLLDTASWGILEIAEVSGGLVGTWRRYRMQQTDLDAASVGTALGALLAAIVRTANALDLSLESLMDQQIQRAKTPPPRGMKSSPLPHTALSEPRADDPPRPSAPAPPRRTREQNDRHH